MGIAVLISGTGRTLCNLIERKYPIDLVISSTDKAKGLKYAEDANVKCYTTIDNDEIFKLCKNVDLICLAGWIKRIEVPSDFVNRIMNIHPSLLPSFGGHGYYGSRVHEEVLKRGCKITGCTVHFVDDKYDHGPIVVQKSVNVLSEDTSSSLAARVFQAECEAYPEAIDLFLQNRLKVKENCVFVLGQQHIENTQNSNQD